MNGKTANLEINNQLRPIVASVGNAWIICNSKSRPGFKYYFNTLSGQAVWNLSPEEIEKAKKFTKALPISEIEKCPEPSSDPPMDPTSQPTPLRAFNEHTGQIPSQIPNVFPMNLLNMDNLSGLSAVRGLNPFIWNNPATNSIQTQPIIYVVAQPPVGYSSSQTLPQNLPQQLYGNLCERKENTVNTCGVNNMFNRDRRMLDNEDRVSFRNEGRGGNRDYNKSDLRQKLIRKRTKSLSGESSCQSEQAAEPLRDFPAKNKRMYSQSEPYEESSKYDLTGLEKLKPPNSTSNNWFIVVDTEIILENFQFLNKVTDPERNCYLFVPDHVMCELQDLVSSGSDMPTRRILRFLTQQIEYELAFKGNEITNAADNSYKMFATCEELAMENNVILLSNSLHVERFKKAHKNVHVLNLNEFKLILNDKNTNRSTIMKSPTLSIKIHVPNDSHSKVVLCSPKKKETRNVQDFQVSQPLDNYRDEVDNSIPPVKTPEPVECETRLQSSTSSKNEERKQIKLSRNPHCSVSTENSSQSRYRWRKKRVNSCSKTDTSKSVSIDQTVDTGNLIQQEVRDGNSNLLPEINQDTVISPARAPSLERSSISSHPKTIDRPNIIIEETSTSGVISNSTLDSESLNSTHKKETVSVCEDVNFVRYHVVGQSMEEVLKTRREEWVLRFVQIMEETLREMLREDSPSESKGYDYTPPWATDLPELSRCIIKRFSNYFNVVDAANRLSFTLHRISDSKGNVSANLEPRQYMDMYSYGVYLIDALKHVTEDCEDLTTAEDSLKKLLYDIQNANQDCSHNDNFPDDLNESVVNAETDNVETVSDKEKPPVRAKFDSEKQGPQDPSCSNSSLSNTFTSGKEYPIQINKEVQQRQYTDVEAKFFSSLSLTKKGSDRSFNTPSCTTNSARLAQTPPHISSPKNQSSPKKAVKISATAVPEMTSSNNKDVSNNDNDFNASTKDAKETGSQVDTSVVRIVRKFTNIAQFEKKLKEIQSENSNELPIDEENEQNNELYMSDNELEDGEIFDEDRSIIDEEEPGLKENLLCEKQDVNRSFQCFIKEYTGELRRPIKMVQKLCTKVVEELKNAREPSLEMKNELRTVFTTMVNMKTSLNSILERDSTEHENNIMGLLKKASLYTYAPDKELLLEYTNINKECLNQINTWHHIVTQIMTAAGMQINC